LHPQPKVLRVFDLSSLHFGRPSLAQLTYLVPASRLTKDVNQVDAISCSGTRRRFRVLKGPDCTARGVA
jgi:hypothetical protein